MVNRDFTAQAPNELWVADFSYLRCWQGVVFFSFVIDVFSRKVVGWQFASHMRTTLVLDALRMALSTRERVQEVRLIHHSDRDSQYVSGDYTQTLADHDVLASVGSTGDAYDNSMAESFLDTFKTELVADRIWQTRSQLELVIVQYISWFNDSRLHKNLGDRSPREIEELHAEKTRTTTPTTRKTKPTNPVAVEASPAQLLMLLMTWVSTVRRCANMFVRPRLIAASVATC